MTTTCQNCNRIIIPSRSYEWTHTNGAIYCTDVYENRNKGLDPRADAQPKEVKR